MDEGMNKAGRLAIACAVAPVLRSKAPRRVALVDKDGKVTGYSTDVEVAKSLLAAKKIELEVEEGIRPKEVMCELCGRIVKAAKNGVLPTKCKPCAKKEGSKAYEQAHREKIKARKKAYKQAHREIFQARQIAYRQANPEIAKAYYQKNKGKERSRGKDRRGANPEKERSRLREYRRAHPEKHRTYNQANEERIKVRKKAYYQANKEKIKARVKAWIAAKAGK